MGISLFNPVSDTVKSVPGLFAYWNAENAVVVGTGITSLPDQSGNLQSARDLIKVTTAPTYTEVDPAFNFKPSISCSAGTAIRLQATFDTSLLQPYTIYLVMNVSTNASTVFWRSNAGNMTGGAGFIVNGGTPTLTMATVDSSSAITSPSALTNQNYVSCGIYNSTGISSMWMNNSQTAFTTSPGDGTVDANDCSVMTIGAFGSAVTYSWTTMACYSGAHDALTRKKIMKYLGNKYSIATT